MFKLNYYIKRRPERTADEFRTFWLGEHASRNTAVIEELGVRQYLKCEALPDHPLTTKGYFSIGCAPCTSAVETGEDVRAGRWRGQSKLECGLHNRPNIIASSEHVA